MAECLNELDKRVLNFDLFRNVIDNDILMIVQSMMEFSPKKRPSAAELLKSKIFDDIR